MSPAESQRSSAHNEAGNTGASGKTSDPPGEDKSNRNRTQGVKYIVKTFFSLQNKCGRFKKKWLIWQNAIFRKLGQTLNDHWVAPLHTSGSEQNSGKAFTWWTVTQPPAPHRGMRESRRLGSCLRFVWWQWTLMSFPGPSSMKRKDWAGPIPLSSSENLTC